MKLKFIDFEIRHLSSQHLPPKEPTALQLHKQTELRFLNLSENIAEFEYLVSFAPREDSKESTSIKGVIWGRFEIESEINGNQAQSSINAAVQSCLDLVFVAAILGKHSCDEYDISMPTLEPILEIDV